MHDEATRDERDETHTNAHDWQRAHDELLRLARDRTRLDYDEGHWLVVANRSRVHARLGYASFAEYIERLFGYSPRFTREKLRVAEALDTLPRVAHALASAEIPWSTARELTRVATPDTETAWLDATHGKTARDVERLVSGHHPGALPHDRPDPRAVRHALHFDVSAEIFATFREALAKLRRDADAPLDDDAALLLMVRHVLGPANDAGRPSYQVSLTVCEHCRTGAIVGAGERIVVDDATLETAACDASHVGHGNERVTASIPPAVRRLVHTRDAGRCQVPGCRHAVFVDVHHIDPRAEGGSNDPENLLTLCSGHHRAVHRGELRLDGRAPDSLTFTHADGTPYGSRSASPGASVASARAFQALRALGFREAESRRALARVAPHVGHDPSAESLVRRALVELTGPARQPGPPDPARKAA